MEENKPEVKEEAPAPQVPSRPNEIKIEHGNVGILQLQLLNNLVVNTNKIIKLLEKEE